MIRHRDETSVFSWSSSAKILSLTAAVSMLLVLSPTTSYANTDAPSSGRTLVGGISIPPPPVIGGGIKPSEPAPSLLTFARASAPILIGTPKVGNTIVGAIPAWSPAVSSYSYQWLRDDTPIPRANLVYYKITTDDIGTSIALKVTGAKTGYESTSALSRVLSIPSTVSISGVPTIAGIAQVGSTLTAGLPNITPSTASVSVQWYRDGVAIPSANSLSYIVAPSDSGYRLSVAVNATVDGITTPTAVSNYTTIVTTPSTTNPGGTSPVEVTKVHSLTNQYRSTYGLNPLTRNAALDSMAQEYAEILSKSDSFGHSSAAFREARLPSGWLMNAENIAGGQRDGVEVVTDWMNSAGHRENIVRPNVNHVGVGYYYNPSSRYKHYWVQVFAQY